MKRWKFFYVICVYANQFTPLEIVLILCLCSYMWFLLFCLIVNVHLCKRSKPWKYNPLFPSQNTLASFYFLFFASLFFSRWHHFKDKASRPPPFSRTHIEISNFIWLKSYNRCCFAFSYFLQWRSFHVNIDQWWQTFKRLSTQTATQNPLI